MAVGHLRPAVIFDFYNVAFALYYYQWRIYIQKFPAPPPPPNRTKFFHFYTCFHRKAPVSEVGASSNEGWHPPPPTGNPGSAPDYYSKCLIKKTILQNIFTTWIYFRKLPKSPITAELLSTLFYQFLVKLFVKFAGKEQWACTNFNAQISSSMFFSEVFFIKLPLCTKDSYEANNFDAGAKLFPATTAGLFSILYLPLFKYNVTYLLIITRFVTTFL